LVEKGICDFSMLLIFALNRIGHKSKVKFYPGDPTKKIVAGDFGRVVYPPKIISYPRDPTTYVPFPTHYAYEPENKDQKHCDLKQG